VVAGAFGGSLSYVAQALSSEAFASATERVVELARDYEPPDFAHVPDADAALFLCAVDHQTGYEREHRVDGAGPYSGSELMWVVALRSAQREPGLLSARRLREASAQDVARWFYIAGETVADPQRRAALWRDLALGLKRDYGGSADRLLAACGGYLGGPHGLIALLAAYDAYADPLAKKSFLFAKIAERRGWLAVADPDAWEVAADNVLMRIALRSGLVANGPLEEVRPATREAFKALAVATGLSPPLLDDLLWELGRDNPDLLGREAGDLREPPRELDSDWY
jgi:hypothetical protein